MTNKTYCVMPWLSVSVDPDGSIKPCCESQYYIKKPDGTKFNLGYDTLEDIHNSQDFIEIRKLMLAGEQVAGCESCYRNEHLTGISSRTNINANWRKQYTNPISDINIKHFDLRFGNICNLMCSSCNPRNSSQLEKELKKSTNLKYFIGEGYEHDINQWYLTSTFDKNIESQLSNIRWLYITGGEPTLVEKNFDLLEKLVSLGKSKSIMLSFNTNMTNTKPKFYNLIKEFKNVMCISSIDGYKDMQEYLRYPSDWKQIDENFKKLIDIGNPVHLLPTMVIQSTNLGNLVGLFEYFENFNRLANKCVAEMSPIILQNPSYFNLVHLPVEYKIKCWNRIEEWLQTKCKFQTHLFHNNMDLLKKLCYIDALSIPDLKKYKEFTSLIDNRKHKLQDVNLELYTVLNNI